jgi:hypothetical protein
MVSMMNSSILDADIKELCIHVIKKLIERTQNDETKSINKNAVYEEAVLHQVELEPLTLLILLSKTRFLRNYLQENISAKVIILMKSKLQT